MIKIKDYEAILKSSFIPEVLEVSEALFQSSVLSDNPSTEFICDFCSLPLPQSVMQGYYNEGLSVLMPVLNSKNKFDINSISPSYISYTGLLNREFVVCYDTSKGMSTAIYTKCESLLEKLYKAGAFDNEEKYHKNMKALFGDGQQDYGNKVVSSLEKNSLALGRLDISSVIGDEVSLDLIVPSKFRDDLGSTFKLYPYTIFPYLSDFLMFITENLKEGSFQKDNKKVIDIRAINVMQCEADGNVKNRKITFSSSELVKAYRRGNYGDVSRTEEAQNMLSNQIRKTTCKWDCLKMYLKGFNTEASLYGVAYSTIRFERLLSIKPTSLKEIDNTQYLVDFDSVRRLFRARVNNWRLQDFIDFNKVLDTESCANIPDRIQMIDMWSNNLSDTDLYKIMCMKRNLFEVISPTGSLKTIENGLDDMYTRKPSAAKLLSFVSLDSDFTARKYQLKDLLSRGVCKIDSFSSCTGAPRSYIATNNDSVLEAAYGPKQLIQFESSKRSIERIANLIKSNKISTFDRFVKSLMDAKIDGLVDYSQLDSSSVSSDWLNILGLSFTSLENNSKDKTPSINPYLVNFRRINADSESEYYGSVDVRNIDSVEFGAQKVKKLKSV